MQEVSQNTLNARKGITTQNHTIVVAKAVYQVRIHLMLARALQLNSTVY